MWVGAWPEGSNPHVRLCLYIAVCAALTLPYGSRNSMQHGLGDLTPHNDHAVLVCLVAVEPKRSSYGQAARQRCVGTPVARLAREGIK